MRSDVFGGSHGYEYLLLNSRSLVEAVVFVCELGIGDECKNQGLHEFTNFLINISGAVGFCM